MPEKPRRCRDKRMRFLITVIVPLELHYYIRDGSAYYTILLIILLELYYFYRLLI